MRSNPALSEYYSEVASFVRSLIEHTDRRNIEWKRYVGFGYLCEYGGMSVYVEFLQGELPNIVIGNNKVQSHGLGIPELIAAIEKYPGNCEAISPKRPEEAERAEEVNLRSFVDASNRFLDKLPTPF